MSRYAKIRKMDISNGPGIRVSVFFQGCNKHCKGCFNKETWDFNGGHEFTNDTIDTILNLCRSKHISGLSILGGEPLVEENIEAVFSLCKKFKSVYPKKTIWLWTGYELNEINSLSEKTQYCFKQLQQLLDVIVDGPFIEDLKAPKLQWRGSTNQKINILREDK